MNNNNNPAGFTEYIGQPQDHSADSAASESSNVSAPGSKARLAAFALMLAVPATLTGCGGQDYDDCDPDIEYCEYDSSGGYYYYNGGSGVYHGKGTPLTRSESEALRSSSSHKGFGSGGSSGLRSGG